MSPGSRAACVCLLGAQPGSHRESTCVPGPRVRRWARGMGARRLLQALRLVPSPPPQSLLGKTGVTSLLKPSRTCLPRGWRLVLSSHDSWLP